MFGINDAKQKHESKNALINFYGITVWNSELKATIQEEVEEVRVQVANEHDTCDKRR